MSEYFKNNFEVRTAGAILLKENLCYAHSKINFKTQRNNLCHGWKAQIPIHKLISKLYGKLHILTKRLTKQYIIS